MGGHFLSEAESYDPRAGSFSATGSMNTARRAFTMTRLNNGRVLIAGGTETTLQGSDLSSAELYDPSTGEWSLTGGMAIAAERRTATLLGNGQVLVAGGDHINNQAYFAEAELYDPVAGTFTVTTTPGSPAMDERVPTRQGWELYDRPRMRGGPAELVNYPREHHSLHERALGGPAHAPPGVVRQGPERVKPRTVGGRS
jgi:hypothetical protein